MYYLYLKQHNLTGLQYLGQTSASDPHKYKGSGKRWRQHISKHGYDVTTKILLMTEDLVELKATGLFFSKLWGVSKSPEYANLKDEEGDGGWSHLNIGDTAHKERSKRAAAAVVNRHLPVDSLFVAGSDRTKELSILANQKRLQMIGANSRVFSSANAKISAYQTEHNSMANKCWCVPAGTIADFESVMRVFPKDKIPKNWLTIHEARDILKNKKNGTYGKMWICSDTEKKNALINKSNPLPSGWRKGRNLEY